jgi:hypothetical protein
VEDDVTWNSYFCAPLVFATMIPFWFLVMYLQAVLVRLPTRHALTMAAWFAPAGATVVWVLLYLVPGLASGVYQW